MTLDHSTLEQDYCIEALHLDETARQHLYTLGFTEGTKLKCALIAPGGDPIAFWIRGSMIALRKSELQHITATAGV